MQMSRQIQLRRSACRYWHPNKKCSLEREPGWLRVSTGFKCTPVLLRRVPWQAVAVVGAAPNQGRLARRLRRVARAPAARAARRLRAARVGQLQRAGRPPAARAGRRLRAARAERRRRVARPPAARAGRRLRAARAARPLVRSRFRAGARSVRDACVGLPENARNEMRENAGRKAGVFLLGGEECRVSGVGCRVSSVG